MKNGLQMDLLVRSLQSDLAQRTINNRFNTIKLVSRLLKPIDLLK
ncbi:hypothetical protein [Fictibacillus sp. FJAT-27399]|nr:hypothetical protein [Fictibacillus sp. FJAT-27399]